MTELNLGLRFLLELAGIVALAYWGWTASDDPVMRLVLAIAAPAALIVIWALVVAPRARNAIPHAWRMAIGTGLLLVAAGALVAAGLPVVGFAFGAVALVNAALMIWLGFRWPGEIGGTPPPTGRTRDR